VAQHGSTSSQHLGLVDRMVIGWHDVRHAQHQLALKNHPWLVGASIHHVRRMDS
jgi:hypothetical protein